MNVPLHDPFGVFMKRPLLLTFLFVCLLLPLNAYLTPKGGITSAQSGENLGQLRKASHDLKNKVDKGAGNDLVRVIIQPVENWDATLDSDVRNAGATDVRQFQNFRAHVVTMPASAALALASRQDIFHVSLDQEIRTLGHVSLTTGADIARLGTDSTGHRISGTGVGVAVLDSGVDTAHKAFLDGENNLRVFASRDFTGESRTDDPYGHGTHVASIAAGNGVISEGTYLGIAPNANLINLRVLNSDGVGSISGVLDALDWVMSNRSIYNIRVVNMSLGMPSVESFENDPLCLTVRGLVNAGIVVAVAAGNNGKDSAGNKIYGRIHSPGNEPSALTVGASNTFGTDARDDDTVASYSSRGPTRSFWEDDAGVK